MIMKKIAVLLLAHKNFDQVNQFIEQFNELLYDIYVHVDSKVKVYRKTSKNNVFYLEDVDRVDIRWAHFSMVEAMVNLLRCAHKDIYTHYWFVSGQDLLLKSSIDIYQEINTAHLHDSFINFFEEKFQKKFQYRVINAYPKFMFNHKKIIKIMRKFYTLFTRFLAYYKRKKQYLGSQWSILNYEFVNYLLKDNIYNEYEKRFRKTLVPDESFFQTIIKESSETFNYIDHSVYLCWLPRKSNPKILCLEDLESLLQSKHFIARKFDVKIDYHIIDEVIERTCP